MEQDKQNMRLIDIFVLSPFFIYSGVIKSNLPKWIRAGLIVTGATTFIYNANNYLKQKSFQKNRL